MDGIKICKSARKEVGEILEFQYQAYQSEAELYNVRSGAGLKEVPEMSDVLLSIRIFRARELAQLF
jgi:hypothetical protein